jgi:acylglycerol lipase
MPGELKNYRAADGTDIYYRQWNSDSDRGVLVYLHGIKSHTGWFTDTADKLNQRGFTIYALERRGSGVNKTDRGYVENYNVLIDDLKGALELIRKENPENKIYLMGLCWGGKLAVAFASLWQDMIDGLILVTPAIKARVDLTFPQKLDVLVSNFIRPRKLFNIPIEDELFTKNPKYLEFIKSDQMKLTKATARFFFETAMLDMYNNGAAPKITVPILLLLAGNDLVVNTVEVRRWFGKTSTNDKTLKVYEGSCHSLEFEDEAKELVEDITGWADEHKG